MAEANGRGHSLHNQILLGLFLGAAAGIGAYFTGQESPFFKNEILARILTFIIEPVGQIFLNLLLMTVVPLVFCSLSTGVANLGDLKQLGRVGAWTFAYFVITMTLALLIGLTLVNTLRPGIGLDETTRTALLQSYRGQVTTRIEKPADFGIHTFVNIVPRNPMQSMVSMDMLGVIFFALMVGIGLTLIDSTKSRQITQILEGVNALMIVIINLAMRLAPYGVFAFLFKATASFGFELLRPLGWYVVVVLFGLALHMFGTFSVLLALLSRVNPWWFFQKVRAVIVTAFSTSSSNATLPTSLKVTEEELGVPRQIAGFVLPLGATMNMNGTALFEGVTVVFLAQVFGVNLSLSDQAIVIVLAVLTAIGAAGVPGGSIPLLAMVLATVRVPPEGIAVIIGVDRILDMCRTTLNVVGDITAATFVARVEGLPLACDPTSDSPPGGPGLNIPDTVFLEPSDKIADIESQVNRDGIEKNR